jgi:hypothetical protein
VDVQLTFFFLVTIRAAGLTCGLFCLRGWFQRAIGNGVTPQNGAGK